MLWAGLGLGAFYLALIWVNLLLGHLHAALPHPAYVASGRRKGRKSSIEVAGRRPAATGREWDESVAFVPSSFQGALVASHVVRTGAIDDFFILLVIVAVVAFWMLARTTG
jgi:hypothetical protein